ncbi:hypothetical protein NEILACOT_04753 [Neisseria lactamica ATCC 23970]|uniref:Uncharacterized protein n=1 Tax=Neisseria lactamica ATCC 23970 TaxID=546265 RepID=D0WB29_NEILA|nr:hypothetical protein NEILACOT_04753 [Neisseria lactamica ATCC 23970]
MRQTGFGSTNPPTAALPASRCFQTALRATFAAGEKPCPIIYPASKSAYVWKYKNIFQFVETCKLPENRETPPRFELSTTYSDALPPIPSGKRKNTRQKSETTQPAADESPNRPRKASASEKQTAPGA